MNGTDTEARGVVRNGRTRVVVLIERDPASAPGRFVARIESTGEVIASGLLYGTDTEARGVVRDGRSRVVILIERHPASTNGRFIARIESTGEVIASGLLYGTMDAAVDCWLDGYAHGYDAAIRDTEKK